MGQVNRELAASPIRCRNSSSAFSREPHIPRGQHINLRAARPDSLLFENITITTARWPRPTSS